MASILDGIHTASVCCEIAAGFTYSALITHFLPILSAMQKKQRHAACAIDRSGPRLLKQSLRQKMRQERNRSSRRWNRSNSFLILTLALKMPVRTNLAIGAALKDRPTLDHEKIARYFLRLEMTVPHTYPRPCQYSGDRRAAICHYLFVSTQMSTWITK